MQTPILEPYGDCFLRPLRAAIWKKNCHVVRTGFQDAGPVQFGYVCFPLIPILPTTHASYQFGRSQVVLYTSRGLTFIAGVRRIGDSGTAAWRGHPPVSKRKKGTLLPQASRQLMPIYAVLPRICPHAHRSTLVNLRARLSTNKAISQISSLLSRALHVLRTPHAQLGQFGLPPSFTPGPWVRKTALPSRPRFVLVPRAGRTNVFPGRTERVHRICDMISFHASLEICKCCTRHI